MQTFYLLQPFYFRFQNFDGCYPSLHRYKLHLWNRVTAVDDLSHCSRIEHIRYLTARAPDNFGDRMLSVVFAVAGVRVRKYLKSEATGSIPAHRINSR